MATIDFMMEVNEQQATEMMIYHLRCASAFFENTHDDEGYYAKILAEKLPNGWDVAAKMFIETLVAHYEQDDDEYKSKDR